MGKYFHISIPDPCTQQWERMEPNSQGRFCQSCSKTVVDFTAMSDEQLLQFFKSRHENTCGRFHSDQLNKSIPIPSKKIPWVRYFFQFTLPALLLSYKTTAQHLMKSCFSVPVESRAHTSALGKSDFKLKVRGTITDRKAIPIRFASVLIRGTRTGVAADSMGRFTLSVPFKGAELEVSALGYENSLVKINAGQTDTVLNIQLTENVYTCSNEVIVTATGKRRGCYIAGAVVIGKSRRYQRADSITKPITVLADKIFPNPATRNGTIAIRWKNPVENNFQFEISNSIGQIVQTGTIQTSKSTRQSVINLNLRSAGIYFIHLMSSTGTNKQVLKLVVQ
jgi:hypothetical protein